MLYQQQNKWSCVLTAFANTFDIEQFDLMKKIGHDGSSIIWENEVEPYCYRGFHPQEIIPILITKYYKYAVQVELRPIFSFRGGQYEILLDNSIIKEILEKHDCVIVGLTKTNKRHAASWIHKSQIVFDPCGIIYPLDYYSIENLYLKI